MKEPIVTAYSIEQTIDGTVTAYAHRYDNASGFCGWFLTRDKVVLGVFEKMETGIQVCRGHAKSEIPSAVVKRRWLDAKGQEDMSW